MRALPAVLLLLAVGAAHGQGVPRLTEHARLVPPDTVQGHGFGFSVAAMDPSGVIPATVLVAAPGDRDDGVPAAGSVYVYERDSGTGAYLLDDELHREPRYSGAGLGWALAALPATMGRSAVALIGAYREELTNPYRQGVGAAYVFERESAPDGAWLQGVRLSSILQEAYDGYGRDIAMDRVAALDRALVGVPGDTSVYVLEREPGMSTWSHTARLTAANQDGSERFGWAVALAGNVAVVGAESETVATTFAAGAAYVFELDPTSGTWTEAARLVQPEPQTHESFGGEVAVALAPGSKEIVLVSGPDRRSSGGGAAVYVYERVGGVWGRTGTLPTPSVGRSNFGFRIATAMTPAGLVVVVTDPNLSHSGFFRAGAATVFLYAPTTRTWTEVATLVASDPDDVEGFGSSVAVSPQGRIVVGTSLARYGEPEITGGAAYVYELGGLFGVAAENAPGYDGSAPAVLVERVWPLPAAAAATVAYRLATGGSVRVTVLDALGREVAVVSEGERPAGAHTARLDVSRLAPGVYAVRVASAGGAATGRLVVIR